MIDFSRNHFELLGLPARYRVDAQALEHAYRELQGSVHPDRHAGARDAQKRLALQASARVNEAYRTLRDPVARAQYLLQLRGIDTATETDNRLPMDFLACQLERREAADEATAAHDDEALAQLIGEVRVDATSAQHDVAELLDGDDFEAAAARVRELRFLTKLAADLEDMQASELER